jgi:alginate O-acetyltransferase complex protein AlgI
MGGTGYQPHVARLLQVRQLHQRNLVALGALAGIEVDPGKDVHLPLGISFFTFQAISYIVDIYRRQVPAQKSILEVGLYIALFPQLIAGPIVRYGNIAAQLRHRVMTLEGFAYGVRRFVLGLAKKVLIANVLGQTADEIFAHQGDQLDWSLAWLGVVCYALQIYFDFSGYSDMAIGLGRMFGFHFPENFDHPYTSRSVREFWRRWHISLSRWFRDYLYIPLGGSRHGRLRTHANLIIVFLLCGLWHGAAWNFVIWGLFHGIFLVAERGRLGHALMKLPGVIQHAYLLLVVLIGWVFFRAEDLPAALAYLGALFGFSPRAADAYLLIYLDAETLLALIAGIMLTCVPRLTTIADPAERGNGVPVAIAMRDTALVSALALSIIYVSAESYNPFIYFRF